MNNFYNELKNITELIKLREYDKTNIETTLRVLNGYAANTVKQLENFGIFSNLRKAFFETNEKEKKNIINCVLKMFFEDNYRKVKFVNVADFNYSFAMNLRFIVGKQEYEITVPDFKRAEANNWTDCIFKLTQSDKPNSVIWTTVVKDYNYVTFTKAINKYIFGEKTDDTNNKQ